MKKVMLDPGHGDFDPGAIGNGLKEADLTWNIATKTGAILEQCGVAVFYTREQYKTATKDKNFELAYRCKLANEKRVDAYVSLHINAGGGSGYESYH